MRNLLFYQQLSKEIKFENGLPFWFLPSTTNRKVKNGALAGSICRDGYRRISVCVKNIRKSLTAHRLHWFQIHGPFILDLDHINRNKDDNRIENLRLTNPSENSRNRSPRGSSKFMGVSWHKKQKKWFARCFYKNNLIHLGSFSSEIEAAKAYDSFCIQNNLLSANLNFIKRGVYE